MNDRDIIGRRMANQFLIAKTDKMTAVRALNGFQSQFTANAFHSMRIRCFDYSDETAADGLVRNWTIRGTVHIFAESDLPLFKYRDDGRPYKSEEWRGYKSMRTGEVVLSPERQKYLSRVVIAALGDGTQSREQLKELCRNAGMTESEESVMFEQWGGGMRDLCERGFLNHAVQQKKAFTLSPPFEPMEAETAKLELARRYFTNFAPLTLRDAAYYFGVSQTTVKEWLSKIDIRAFSYDGRDYFYVKDDEAADIPRCVYLAGFDQYMLGYQKSDNPSLPPEYLRRIFNLAGIVMHALLIDGIAAARWKRKRKTLTIEPFRAFDADEISAINQAAAETFADVENPTVKFM